MKRFFTILAVAAAVFVLPIYGYSQTSTDQSTPGMGGMEAPAGHREAMRMVPARAELLHSLNSTKDQAGSEVQAKLVQKVTLTDGTELPEGAILEGKITTDDMQQKGMSKLALRFIEAHLKNGTRVRIKATIVGFYGPGAVSQSYPASAGDEVPSSWTDGTLQMDQIGVLGGVDLHSKISSRNSGVFVSTKKDKFKLDEGSEIQFAIGPGRGHSAI